MSVTIKSMQVEKTNEEEVDWESIIASYKKEGVHLFVEEGKLKFQAKEVSLTIQKQQFLRDNKSAIITYLLHKEDYLPERYRAFNMTPIQKAYLIGRQRGYELGNVNAHYYTEFEKEHLDENKFEWALNRLIRIHDMLKTVMFADGTQQVMREVPHLKVAVHNNISIKQQTAIREQLKEKEYSLGQWPMFSFEISRVNEKRDCIHLSVDCMLLDAYSLQSMVNDIFKLYNGQSVSTPQYTFKEYVESQEQWVEAKGLKEKSRQYWSRQITNIPKAPMIPYQVNSLSEIEKPVFQRKCYRFTEDESKRFIQKTKENLVTGNSAIAYCLMDTLAKCCDQTELTLNLTMYNRYPLHVEAEDIYGDFTNTSILPFFKKRESILKGIQRVQESMVKAIEFSGYNGIELLREINRDAIGKAIMPVVLTSMLQDINMTDFRETYAVSATPQVVLDAQAYYREKKMVLGFDYVEDAIDNEWLESFFIEYVAKVQTLLYMETWDCQL